MYLAGVGDSLRLLCTSATKTGAIVSAPRHGVQVDSGAVAMLCQEALDTNDYGSALSGRPKLWKQWRISFSTYCDNDASTGDLHEVEYLSKLFQARDTRKRHDCSVRVIETAVRYALSASLVPEKV